MQDRRWVALLAAIFVIGASCGSGTGGDRHAAPTRPQFVDGVAKLEVPLSSRQGAIALAAGSQLVVYGGEGIDRRHALRDDGAVYGLASATWTPMPAGPFTEPLWYPQGVWTGTELVVVGTPCAHGSFDDDTVVCGNAPEAAAFSPSTGSWRKLRAPRLSGSTAAGNTVALRAVGWGHGGALFAYSPTPFDPNVGESLLVFDPESDRWRSIGAPGPPGGLCVTGGRLFQFTGRATSAGGAGIVPHDPMATREWRPDIGWTSVGGEPAPSPDPVYWTQVICGADDAVYAPVFAPPAGVGNDLHWFDPAASGWVDVPDLGAQGQPSSPQFVTISTRRLIWVGDHFFVLERDATAWTERSLAPYDAVFPPPESPVKLPNLGGVSTRIVPDLIAFGQLVVANSNGVQTSEGRMVLGLIDLERLPGV